MVHHRAHTEGANQFTAVGPPTMGPLRPITLRPTIIMGRGTITVRDGVTIVPGDGSSKTGPQARACGLLGSSRARPRSIVATKAAIPLRHRSKKNGHTSGAWQPTRLPGRVAYEAYVALEAA